MVLTISVDEKKKNPFCRFFGPKAKDGYGCMLATPFGMNTAWGEIMVSFFGSKGSRVSPFFFRFFLDPNESV